MDRTPDADAPGAPESVPGSVPANAQGNAQGNVPGTTQGNGLDDALDPRLLAILVCPVTKGPLAYDRAASELISRQAGLAFPVRGGVPIMLPDEARHLDG